MTMLQVMCSRNAPEPKVAIEVGTPVHPFAVQVGRTPACEYALLDRSGHNPQFEEAERFDRTVLDWLERH